MNREQFEEKIDEMIADNMERVRDDCFSMFNSGAIERELYGDDFELPRIILTAAMYNAATRIEPLSAENREEVRNLRNF